MNGDRRRAALVAALLASAATAASLTLVVRGSEVAPIEPASIRTRVERAPDLVLVAAVPPQETPRTASTPNELERVARTSAADAARALARSLVPGAYERRAFETEGRSRLASVAEGELEQDLASADGDLDVVVARAALVRVAPLALERRRDLVARDLATLRALAADESAPHGVLEQAGAALAALGDDADRAALFARLSDPTAPRSAAAARIALESLAGPGAGVALVAEIASELERRADGPVLAIAASFEGAASLSREERDACAGHVEQLVSGADRSPRARSRALGLLRALDRARAAELSRAWLADPSSDAALVRAACASVRGGEIDPDSAGALAADPALPQERRVEIASALLGSGLAREVRPDLLDSVRDLVRAHGTARGSSPRDLRAGTPPIAPADRPTEVRGP